MKSCSIFIILLIFNVSLVISQDYKDLPDYANLESRYLIYLPGKIFEDQGVNAVSQQYGTYHHQEIVSAFQKSGFVVVCENRDKDTKVELFAEKVQSQIDSLLQNGVKPEYITVLGASKGSVIAMLVSSKLKNKDINYVLMANCNSWVKENFDINLHGNVLSIYESSDEFGQSCHLLFEGSTGLNRSSELALNLGIGHGILYKPLEEWVIPTIRWANNEY